MITDGADSPAIGSNPHAIVRIRVEKLFGQFTYHLPAKNIAGSDLSNLFILYGDNGSGKTTILKLLYHLLSYEGGRGHKTAVSSVRFRRFAVDLADGTTIEALRSGKSHEGPYRAAILKGAETIDAIDLPTGRRRDETHEDASRRLASFLHKLKGLNIALHFLSDDRRIQGRDSGEEEFARRRTRAVEISGAVHFAAFNKEEPPGTTTIMDAVGRAASWINQQAYKGSNIGQRNVHSIYTDITKHIVDSSAAPDRESDRQKLDTLIRELDILSARSEAYSHFRLTSELPAGEMIQSLRRAPPETQPVLHNVIRPYVDSIKARLDALESIHTLLETFVENIKIFLGSTKQVSYDLRHGLMIKTRRGEILDLNALSSGEKQLLLLLCSTLAARDQASILIIDEPEISLNVKWQRRLVQALLDCIRGSNAQLIFATHSIELLARHKSQVVKLIDQSGSENPSRAKDNPDDPRREADDRRVGSQV